MRTRATFWIFGAAVALLLLGVVTRDFRFLALVLPLLVFATLASLFAPPRPSLAVKRVIEGERTFEGDEIDVALTLHNTGAALPVLEVYDGLPPGSVVTKGSNRLLLSLAAGETKTLEYTLRFDLKGRYTLGPLTARSRDPLGLYFREITVPGRDGVVVSPLIQDLRRVSLLPRRTRPNLGQVPARIPGLGTEFWAIRKYQGGDDMRGINWKASARLDTLLTNEREAERSGDIILVLDARNEAHIGGPFYNTLELGIRAVVSLAARLLQDRNRVGLVIQRDVLDWVYPAFGRTQLYRIIDAVLAVRPGGIWPFRQIAWVLKRHFPSRALLIIVSPLVDRASLESVRELRAVGFDIILLSPSSLEVERRLLEGNGHTELAHRVLRMRREADVAYLRRFAHVVDWNPEEPLTLALKEASLWQRYRA